MSTHDESSKALEPAGAQAPIGFAQFYRQHFLAEHRHPANRALHVLGTVAGLALLPAAVLIGQPWAILLFPLVHAAPGLLGHRLFERNTKVGDLRVLRKDFSPLWFIVANHVLTLQLARQGLRRVRR